jgi:hypothetical protein
MSLPHTPRHALPHPLPASTAHLSREHYARASRPPDPEGLSNYPHVEVSRPRAELQ